MTSKTMEQLNKIELRGTVGSVYVKTFGNEKVTTFSVATNYSYVSRDGTPVIETTWHQVISWDCPEIGKGSQVHVIGRLSSRRYADANGVQQTFFEVTASKVTVL